MNTKSYRHRGISIIAILSFIYIITGSCSDLYFYEVGAGTTIGPIVQNVTTNSAVITWETVEDSDNPAEVFLNNSERPILGESREIMLTGIVQSNKSRVFHNEVKIPGLQPDTEYTYLVNAEGAVEHSFRTAPVGPSEFSFIVYGDNRATHPGTASNPTPQSGHSNLFNVIRQYDEARFVFHTGDMVYFGAFEFEYEIFFDILGDYAANIPFFPMLGNHDFASDELLETLPLRYFATPAKASGSNSEKYYSADYGPIHLIALDMYTTSYSAGKPQIQWLEEDLQRASENENIRFIILGFHEPIYTGSNHSPVTSLRNTLNPLIKQYNVQVTVAGHNHLYERFLVNYEGHEYYHLVLGGGGGGLYSEKDVSSMESGSAAAYQTHYNADYAFCAFDVVQEADQSWALYGKVINTSNEIVDQFIIPE